MRIQLGLSYFMICSGMLMNDEKKAMFLSSKMIYDNVQSEMGDYDVRHWE